MSSFQEFTFFVPNIGGGPSCIPSSSLLAVPPLVGLALDLHLSVCVSVCVSVCGQLTKLFNIFGSA